MTPVRFVALWGLLVVGCGGSSTGPATVQDACASYAANYCDRFETCAPGLNWLLGFTGMADCVTSAVATCQATSASAHSGYTPAASTPAPRRWPARTATAS